MKDFLRHKHDLDHYPQVKNLTLLNLFSKQAPRQHPWLRRRPPQPRGATALGEQLHRSDPQTTGEEREPPVAGSLVEQAHRISTRRSLLREQAPDPHRPRKLPVRANPRQPWQVRVIELGRTTSMG